MPFLSDGDSSCSEDRNNANHQTELVEFESSRTGELCTLVKRGAYNLRPRKDDSVITQRRSEFARSREQRTRRRIERNEAEEQKKLREYLERAGKRMKEMMDRLPKGEEVDMENRTEIINTDTDGVMELEKCRPYFERPDYGLLKTTLKGASWEVEELALEVASSVVGLQSKGGDTDHFFCSGTIVESSGQYQKIVTVANLVKKCADTDELVQGLTITVYLQNNETCRGDLLYHDFFYNICVVVIEHPVHLPKQGFSSNTKAVSFDESCSRDVVTLGRVKETHALVVNSGKIIPKRSSFDCEELLVSTCRISKAEVGGPLMSFDGNFIGLNYYHHKETPFIPSFIVLKCLQQLKSFRKVVKPWHGLQVRNLFTEACSMTTGVIIEKIEDQSTVKASGLNEGDIINQVNGVYFSNAAELGGILLDIGAAYVSKYQNSKQPDGSDMMAMRIKFGVKGHEGEKTVIVEKFASSGVNRWPFPKPIIVQKYSKGEMVLEEWYAMESQLPTEPNPSTAVASRLMKNTRRRQAKATKKPQIPDTPRPKETPGGSNSGDIAYWSDSDEPQSKFNKYDSGKLQDFESVLKSVVSLVASSGGKRRLCSGTVADQLGKQTWILTSATLVRKPDTQFEYYKPEEIKIEVNLHNGDTVEGFLEMCNLHYNIAIVTIEYQDSLGHLPAVQLWDLPLYYSFQPRSVIALGRDVNKKAIVSCGELVRENSELNCKELMVCLCDISEAFIGGPIMDFQNRFLGIVYSFKETAPFLPVEIAARCIKYHKKKRTLPWLRIRGQALHTLDLDVLETICCKFARPLSGLLVDKICDTSTENCGGIEVGDIISKLDGAALYSGAQFTAMFLDKFEVAMDTPDAVSLQAVVDRPRDKTTFVAKLNIQQVASNESNKLFQNRWMKWKRFGFGEQL
ncbi:unnamed protein product [Urochloa humidicola]